MSASSKTKTRVWLLAVILGTFFVLGIAVLTSGGTPLSKTLWVMTLAILLLVLGLAGVVLVLWLFLLFHELGHFVAGRAVGLKLCSIRVGPLEYEVNPTGRSLKYIASASPTAGLCRMMPVEGPYTIRQLKIFVFGGPIANLVLIIAISSLALAVGVRPEMDWSSISFLQGMMWWATVIVAITGLESCFRGKPISDVSYLKLLFNKEKSTVYANRFLLDADLRLGKRARDWEPGVVEAVTRGAITQAERLIANMFSYYAYLDRGDFEAAMTHLHSAVVDCATPSGNEPVRKLMLLEAAFAFARIENQVKASKEALEASDKIPAEPIPFVRHRAEAAIALAEGDPIRAMAAAEEACQGLRNTYPDIRPNIQAEIDWNQAIIAEAMSAMKTATVGATMPV